MYFDYQSVDDACRACYEGYEDLLGISDKLLSLMLSYSYKKLCL